MLIPWWSIVLSALALFAAGFSWGYREGQEDGFSDGFDDGVKAAAEVERI